MIKNCEIRKPTYSIPKFLYKYYSNTSHALDVIINKRIHLELPDTYNDVFDPALVISNDNLDLIKYDRSQIDAIVTFTHCDYKDIVRSISVEEFDKCRNLLQMFDVLYKHNIPHDIIEYCKAEILKRLQNVKPTNNKMSCFSETPNSELMWAHYGQHLEGVCLVFETGADNQLFGGVHKVNYSKHRVLPQRGNFDIYFNKSLVWSYEQEWRIVVETDEEFCDTESCVGVIFGNKIPWEDWAKMSLIALENGIKIFKAIPDSKLYKIKIVDQYTKNEIQI